MRVKSLRASNAHLFMLSLVLILGALMLIPADVQAQGRGRIYGLVMDSNTKDYLPGANVFVEGTSLGAVSDRNGRYRIESVPAGTHTLRVSYIGYDSYTVEVTVPAGGRIEQDISLQVSAIEGGEVIVRGLREGQIKALSQQRSAPNIANIVDEEQMMRFPDVNSAEVLQRVSGISVERDQGEGRFVMIRGMSAQLSTTTINGEKIPSPQGDVRYVALDAIAADQLSGIEVTKAITPDMDGNAIGGSVNLRTKSALDYPGRVFSITTGSGYDNLRGKPIYQGGITYGNRFGANQNIGVMLSGSFQRSQRGSDNNEMEWGDVELVDETEVPWALEDLEMRDYEFIRDRMTFSGTVDYLLKPGHKFYLSGIYSKYNDSESRRALRVRPGKGDYNSATDISGAAIEAHYRNRDQNQTIYNFAVGGEHEFNSIKLDYRLSMSYAEEDEPRHIEAAFELDEDADMTLDLSNTDTPKWQISNLDPGYEYNPANYAFDAFEVHDNLTYDKDMNASFNVQVPYMLGVNPGTFKFGAKATMKDKDRKENIWEYGYEGDDDLLLSSFVGDYKNEDYLDGAYPAPPAFDPDKTWDYFDANKNNPDQLEGEILKDDTDGGTYNATEDVYAFYGMTTLNFGKMMLLGGFRHEITKNDYTGREVIFNEDGDYEATNVVNSTSTYNNFLPMLHVRYKVTPMTNLRAAVTTGVARPNYETLVPFRIINREDEEMEIGNPDLVPTTSMNFDLLAEHYFQGIGILSGGVFHKQLKDIMYPSVYEIEDETSDYDGYEVEQAIQGEDATLTGIELNWQQQLTFLPGFLSGFGIYANYTYTTSSASVLFEGEERKDIPLAGQSENMANFAISYEKGGFTGRVSVNYHGKFLYELGEDEEQDIYYDNHIQWDIAASQNITKGLQLYLQAINMNNEPMRYYIGKTDRPIQREFYSWWLHAGLKYNL
ncbi:TonB-dependent receptor [candidate division KSB1 bacterium]|nr:TonB-dependent receptor [candidate division KSB1 bacterium]